MNVPTVRSTIRSHQSILLLAAGLRIVRILVAKIAGPQANENNPNANRISASAPMSLFEASTSR